MRSPASDRYESDPQFKTLVDLIRCELEQSHFTPTELREAVMLACCPSGYQYIRLSAKALRAMPGYHGQPIYGDYTFCVPRPR